MFRSLTQRCPSSASGTVLLSVLLQLPCNGLAHSDGEIATARACARAGIIIGLSSFATASLEGVKEASGSNANVLQLYLFEEKVHSIKLINRAKKAGYKAALLTVHTPYLGRRNLEIRNQFKLPAHLKIAIFSDDPDEEEDVEVEHHSDPDHPGGRQTTKVRQRRSSSAGYYDGKKRVVPSGPITFHSHAQILL